MIMIGITEVKVEISWDPMCVYSGNVSRTTAKVMRLRMSSRIRYPHMKSQSKKSALILDKVDGLIRPLSLCPFVMYPPCFILWRLFQTAIFLLRVMHVILSSLFSLVKHDSHFIYILPYFHYFTRVSHLKLKNNEIFNLVIYFSSCKCICFEQPDEMRGRSECFLIRYPSLLP